MYLLIQGYASVNNTSLSYLTGCKLQTIKISIRIVRNKWMYYKWTGWIGYLTVLTKEDTTAVFKTLQCCSHSNVQ